MAIDPPIRSVVVAPFLRQVARVGGDVEALIRRFGLPATAATDREVTLSLHTLHAFLDEAAKAARDAHLGLTVARDSVHGSFGLVEFACRSAPTVRAAVTRMMEYVRLLNDLAVISLEERDGLALLDVRIPGEPTCVGRHANEYFMATLLTHARYLVDARAVPRRVWLAHAAPHDISPLVEAFGTRNIDFLRESNGVALPTTFLDAPLSSSDPPLLAFLDAQASTQLPHVQDTSLAARLRRVIRDNLGARGPMLAIASRGLGMSNRTLQRRLAEEGTRLNAVVDEVRHDVALQLVRDRNTSLGEIAYLLGYSDLTTFLRAFKRWTGHAPRVFRNG